MVAQQMLLCAGHGADAPHPVLLTDGAHLPKNTAHNTGTPTGSSAEEGHRSAGGTVADLIRQHKEEDEILCRRREEEREEQQQRIKDKPRMVIG